jgi:hypothetical protein
VGPRAGLDKMKKRKLLTLPELELQPLRRPARSYPGSPRDHITSNRLNKNIPISYLMCKVYGEKKNYFRLENIFWELYSQM